MPSASQLSDPSYCNNAVLRRATRRIGQLYDDVLAPSGLRATQHAILSQIKFMNEPSLRELAAALVMDLSALGHTLKPLVREGILRLVSDPDDRRVKRVAFTKAGERKFAETSRLWRQAQDRFEQAYGRKRAADLRALLNSVTSEAFGNAFWSSAA